MTTTTDLSRERLDELEDILGTSDDLGIIYIGDGWHPITRVGELRALIAMARAKQAAERERDALRVVARIIADAGLWDWHTELSHWVLDGMPDDYDDEVIGLSVAEARAALAQPTTEGGE